MDAVELANLTDLKPLRTWINGLLVAEHGESLIPSLNTAPCNKFVARKVSANDFSVPATSGKVRVIKAFDGELLTQEWQTAATIEHEMLVPDIQRDILFLSVINDAFLYGFTGDS